MARKYQGGTRSGYTILVIDDSPEILESTRLLLESEGHNVLVASDGESGLAALGEERVHLILCDYFMPAMTGEEDAFFADKFPEAYRRYKGGVPAWKPNRKLWSLPQALASQPRLIQRALSDGFIFFLALPFFVLLSALHAYHLLPVWVILP